MSCLLYTSFLCQKVSLNLRHVVWLNAHSDGCDKSIVFSRETSEDYFDVLRFKHRATNRDQSIHQSFDTEEIFGDRRGAFGRISKFRLQLLHSSPGV